MRMPLSAPAAAYRRVALEARIETARGADVARLCLEEAVAALGQALAVLERGSADRPRACLERAQTIMIWLAQTTAPDHPLSETLRQFYGGLAAQIGASIVRPDPAAIARVRGDCLDLLSAARA